MKRTLILTYIAMLCHTQSNTQTKLWDGGGGSDNSWTNRFNWAGDVAPGSADNVLLDNSIVTTNYTVTLSAGSTSISVSKLIITPSTGNNIRFIIPSTNTAAPAFTASGPGYGILINNGGIFQNASGLTSGTSLIVADSIRINNGGRYIHNTRTVHATNIVQLLSKAPGAESGIFEFDIPSGGTLSMSNRTYGTLILSSTSAGVPRTYTCSGSNTLTVNGSFIINPDVTLSVDLATANGNIIVKGDLIQNGGTFNLASGAGNTTILKVAGNITQAATGQITESNTGLPAIELNGTSVQSVFLAGAITNNVSFIVNNPSGATLLSPLSLPYKLILQKGQIRTSSANLLTLQSNCTLQADSLSAISFINGPLHKQGLSSTSRFLFPVGKSNMHRWLELQNTTGNFTVEYHRANPHSLNSATQTPINHISALEYWIVKADAFPAPSATVKLSFDNVNSGGVTSLPALLVARLKVGLGSWTSLGNSLTEGTASTNGFVTANIPVTDFDNVNGDFFTLATNIVNSNPLPLRDTLLRLRQAAQRNVLFTKLLQAAPSIVQGTTTVLTVLAEKEEQIRIVTTNQAGQAIRIQQFLLNKGSNKLSINFSGLSSGVYQLTGYTATDATNTLRAIKQ